MAVERWMSQFERWREDQPSRRVAVSRVDWFMLAVLAVCSACSAWLLGSQLTFLNLPDFNDTWYGADTARVFSNLTDRAGNHRRTSIHPLFSLIVATPLIVLVKATGI